MRAASMRAASMRAAGFLTPLVIDLLLHVPICFLRTR
jgi:hypothetical protein